MKRFEHHFEPQTGWMNDPNGLVYFRGQYHAFFQHFPYAPKWGPMHWGHAVSRDLIHWEELPIALRPDQEYENNGGCFSGSAIVKDDKLYLFYTSVGMRLGQTQSMAVSEDGIHFTKYAGNPILRACPIDSGAPCGNRDFRDPKVTEINGHYYMVCGSGQDGIGKVLLFRSDDLIHWEFVSILIEGCQYGTVIECPDFFFLDGQYVLMFSHMGRTEYATHFMVGSFDGVHFTPQQHVQIEAGPDFYAPQTLAAPDARRILIGWMYHWQKPLPAGAAHAGALSLARTLQIENGHLLTRPVAEAESLLRTASPYVSIQGNRLLLSDGRRTVLSKTFPAIRSLQILEDQKAVEVFVNDGEWAASTWLDDEVFS